MSIIGQMFATKKADNESYTLKEMLQQLDRKDFEAAMDKEVKHMFDNEVWEKVPRSEMHAYYKKLRRMRVNVKQEQLILI
eukprot:10464318-Ditylum_brightwellii.AAC.1